MFREEAGWELLFSPAPNVETEVRSPSAPALYVPAAAARLFLGMRWPVPAGKPRPIRLSVAARVSGRASDSAVTPDCTH